MPQLRLPDTTTKPVTVQLGGGLDLLTPPSRMRPGACADALNFQQSVSGGYERVGGYERFDGHLAPSAATYFAVTCTVVAEVLPGQTITGALSGATGVVLSSIKVGLQRVISYTRATGQLLEHENIKVAGVVKGVIDELGRLDGMPDYYDADQQALAANVYRTFINPVPGAGPVRGVFYLRGFIYAFRNDYGNVALQLWKSSSTGWVQVPLGFEVAFTAGTSEYFDGETLTQGGVSATINRVALESGSWDAGTAAGRLHFSAATGGAFAAGAATGGGAATLGGAATAIALEPGGRVQTDEGNFDGTVRIYGCDGVNRGWEFDGTALLCFTTRNVPDVPENIRVHKDHVFVSFGANVQCSGIGTPFNWTAIAGSVAFRFAAPVSSLVRQTGDQSTGILAIITETATSMLYGSSGGDFRPVDFEESAGGRRYGAQRIGGQMLTFGNVGVFSLSATQQFGNFEPSSMTLNIRPLTSARRNQCISSLVHKERSQYRVFFNDGFALYLTLVNGKLMGSMPMAFPNKAFVTCQGASPDGEEVSYFGSDNGMVYRLDSGTSFDGQKIPAYFTLATGSQGMPQRVKRYRSATFEAQGDGYCDYEMTFDLNYGGGDRPQGTTPVQDVIALSSVYWDEMVWDEFVWDGANLAPSTLPLSGSGQNIALRVASNSDRYASLTFNSVTIEFSPRRQLRHGT